MRKREEGGWRVVLIPSREEEGGGKESSSNSFNIRESSNFSSQIVHFSLNHIHLRFLLSTLKKNKQEEDDDDPNRNKKKLRNLLRLCRKKVVLFGRNWRRSQQKNWVGDEENTVGLLLEEKSGFALHVLSVFFF